VCAQQGKSSKIILIWSHLNRFFLNIKENCRYKKNKYNSFYYKCICFAFFQRTKESYINEIRICFNKTLQLTNCDGIYHFPTNCVKSKEIIYPSRVPRYYVTQT